MSALGSDGGGPRGFHYRVPSLFTLHLGTHLPIGFGVPNASTRPGRRCRFCAHKPVGTMGASLHLGSRGCSNRRPAMRDLGMAPASLGNSGTVSSPESMMLEPLGQVRNEGNPWGANPSRS
ncbi:MAG: hypothetical protein CM1200mP14_28190 [Gammaproteobacteria bacterium]|nr:MAG: hypothetical protein CM1200mP14_28190 [Gammaproteobacteria bacterium]